MEKSYPWLARVIAIGSALCLSLGSGMTSAQNVNITDVEQNIFLEKIDNSIIVINQISANINVEVRGPGKAKLVKSCKKAKGHLEKAQRKASRRGMSVEDAEQVTEYLDSADTEMEQAKQTANSDEIVQGRQQASGWLEWVDLMVEDANDAVEEALED
jgi:hypothetical protein